MGERPLLTEEAEREAGKLRQQILPTEEAEREAGKLRQQILPNNDLPVDPVIIATSLGLRVFEAVLESSISGALVKIADEDDPVILLNDNEGERRQRFTCAHELGHYVRRINSGEDRLSYQWIDHRRQLQEPWNNEEEQYANAFAAELLMPRLLITAARQSGKSVVDLASEFQVSASAMGFRLKNLGMLNHLEE